MESGLKIQGFSRVQIEQDGNIVGDSGYIGPNQITNEGVRSFLARALGSITGSSYISYAGIGEGTQPGASDTTLQSECSGTNNLPQRASVNAVTSGSTGVRFTGTFSSSNSFVTAQETIKNIGLFAATTTNATIFAGNTFSQSTIDTNQNANFTYDITFTPS